MRSRLRYSSGATPPVKRLNFSRNDVSDIQQSRANDAMSTGSSSRLSSASIAGASEANSLCFSACVRDRSDSSASISYSAALTRSPPRFDAV